MAKWLKQRREYLRLNQDELAARLQIEGLDVKRTTISSWENGYNNIPLDDPQKINILAKVLRMSVHDLLIAAGYKLDDDYSNEAMQAATLIDTLDPKYKIMALDVLERLAHGLKI